ncbi:MAG: IS110 family transposase [Undibacterium sp.]
MTVYIGVDFHPYEQTVAYADDADGEVGYRRFLHSDKQSIKAFYRKCGTEAVIGVEATGCLWWFEKLLFDNGIKLRIGDPRMIRRAALSRHKNDFRDAETILDLLMRDQFPAIVPRSEESREVLDLLHYRQTLVQKRTSIANQVHAFARSKGLSKFRLPGIRSRKQVLAAQGTTETESLLLGSRLLLFDELTRQIEVTEAKLEERAFNQRAIELLRTHPGIGPITSMALVHTLGDVRRFRRKEEVVSFVGLDPLEKSSGEKRRMGSISKHGSRLVRHLLGQAAQACRDKKIRKFYSEVSRRRGRPKAKVAAARKLLIHCYVMLRDGVAYEEFQRRGEVGLCEGSGEVTGKPAQSLNV